MKLCVYQCSTEDAYCKQLLFLSLHIDVAPYHLVVFEVLTPKSGFFLTGARTITPKESMNT